MFITYKYQVHIALFPGFVSYFAFFCQVLFVIAASFSTPYF